MSLKLYNTLTGKKEEFKPIESGKVGMYNCGPTVYNNAHIGNLRAYIFTDILRRTLEWNGYKVKQVMNVTDVGQLTSDADEGEDKMVKALRREDKPMTLEAMREIGTFYKDAFISDLKSLNIKLPLEMPRASDHIEEDIEIIKRLEQKDIAYKISDGLYFDISKFPNYGKLGNIKQEGLKEGARVEINPEKKNPADFNLWKLSSGLGANPDTGAPGWESPWGKGFPGWHIECSAMSRKYLGQPFDIHTGGIDHIPTHHQNEIAQSEAAFGLPLANYWMHNEHLIVPSGKKMAKSGKDFIILQTLRDEGIYPAAYRYYLLLTHYRKPINFSTEALQSASTALINLVECYANLKNGGQLATKYVDKYRNVINDDLNTPQAIAAVWQMLKDNGISDEDKKTTLEEFDKTLGLNLAELSAQSKMQEYEIPRDIKMMEQERNEARLKKDWATADKIRCELERLGYEVSDKGNTSIIKKVRAVIH